MKKIVIIGAGEFQNPLIEKAKKLGYETHVFAWKCGDIGERTADYFYPVSITEKEVILRECEQIRPDAVVSIASDLATLTVGYIAQRLGLPHNSEACIQCSTDKFKMRKAFRAAGILTPEFAQVSGQQGALKLEGMSYPLIVKPTDRSGSRGITKVWEESEAAEAVKRAIDCSFAKSAIVEEFIEGDEYSCECISQYGVHHLLALTKKYTTNAPHFIETGHIEPSGIEDSMLQKIKETVFASLDALGVTVGASHTEFRISPKNEPVIIEIGARMGGDCIGSHLVPLSTGYDFTKMVVEAAAGIPISLERHAHYKTAAIRFLLEPDDIRNMQSFERNFPEIVVEKSPLHEENLNKAADSSTRAGYYIMAGNDREAMENMLKSDRN